MITESKRDYLSLFRGYKSEVQKVGNPIMPRFLMRISCGKSTVIEFDPPLSEIHEVIQEGLGFVLHTMDSLPRPDFILYGPIRDKLLLSQNSDSLIKDSDVSFDTTGGPEIRIYFQPKETERSVKILENIAISCFEKVQSSLKKYDHFLQLYSNETDDEIVTFLGEDHSFEEYTEVIIHN